MVSFDADLTTISSGFEILDKGEYIFVIGKPVTFRREGQKGENYGLRFPLVVEDGDRAGKKVSYSAYLHTEGGISAAKRFGQAVSGFSKDEEREYNEFLANLADGATHVNCQPGEEEIGEYWASFEGKRVAGSVDIQVNPINDQKNQNWKSWSPAK